MLSQRIFHPDVHFPPPTLFVIGILSGWRLQAFRHLTVSQVVPMPAQEETGCVAIVIGSAILIWALTTFRRARTAIYPNQPARQIVTHGPYRFSRNPMYVALTFIMLGVGLVADNLWMVMFVPPTLLLLTVFVIRREEAYLADAFSDGYATYCSRVRRWL